MDEQNYAPAGGDSGGDWFGALLQTGTVIAQTVGGYHTAKEQAKQAATIERAHIAAAQRAFQENMLVRQTPNQSGITSPNMILIIMLGITAFFIINQANK